MRLLRTIALVASLLSLPAMAQEMSGGMVPTGGGSGGAGGPADLSTATGTLSTSQIANGAVTAVKLGTGAAASNLGAASVTNTMLANPSMTVGGVTCTLGGSCTPAGGGGGGSGAFVDGTSNQIPGATTSVTTMGGLGVATTNPAVITPASSGRVRFAYDGECDVTNIAAQCTLALAYGSGSAPAKNAAVAGTVCTGVITAGPYTTGSAGGIPVHQECIATGLAVGTAYWFDVQIGRGAGSTTNTATLNKVHITATEF